jgi:3-oxoacyl-(acyl-carrier-protein) synthase
MSRRTYIRSSACISPQKTFGDDGFLISPVEYNDTRLRAIEPNYADFVDPKLARRMSHNIKMGVAAAKQCLITAGINMPGAIITGTAYGCVDDTVTFLTRMIEMKEEMLPPTAFIQSTHNTVAAQIALMLKCHNYNSTFVHKGISFESALQDGLLLLREGETDNVLVGGIDELNNAAYTILGRLGVYKRWPLSNLSLLNTHTNGTIGGEGASFFLLTDKASFDNLAEIKGIQNFFKPNDSQVIEQKITAFLARHNLKIDDIDLIITGKNGDTKNDAVYSKLNETLFKNKTLANYKHLCGEYPTSAGFALWLASNIIKRGEVPAVVLEHELINTAPKRILVYNHYFNTYHSLMLVSA